MNLISSRYRVILLLPLVYLGILSIYSLQISPAYTYLGYKQLSFDWDNLVCALAAALIVGILIPIRISRPTDFLSLFYSLIILLPYSVLYPIRGVVSPEAFIIAFLALAFPLVAVKFLTRTFSFARLPSFISEQKAFWLLGAFAVFGLALAFLSPTSASGFGLDSVYERRLQGRDVYQTRSLVAYLNAMIVNGIAPFFGFYSGLSKKYAFLFFAFLLWLCYFFLLGLKAPLGHIFFGFLLGRSLLKGNLKNFTVFVLFLILLLFGACLVEERLFKSIFVADYVVRRLFTTPSYLTSVYMEFFNVVPSWSLFSGVSTANGVTYEVGELFLGQDGLNANINGFIYYLASGGLPGYLFSIIFAASVFSFMDSAYRHKRNSIYLFMGFSYSILLLEASPTTAFVSSGIGLLLLATSFTPAGDERGKVTDRTM